MPTIMFRNLPASTIFYSMVISMRESALDDEEAERARRLAAVMQWMDENLSLDDSAYPLTRDISDDLVETMNTTLENCLDTSSGSNRSDDPEWDEYLFKDDVTIMP